MSSAKRGNLTRSSPSEPAAASRKKDKTEAATAPRVSRRKTEASTATQKTPRPAMNRGKATFDKLVRAAAELLATTGFEKLTSNAICSQAGVTPPTFYHYFKDKYEVLEELADQLLGKQNEAFASWLEEYAAGQQLAPTQAMVERWFFTVADFVAQEPGGIWTIRALRALPNLSHVRLDWQRRYTEQIFEVVRRFVDQSQWPQLWSRIRIVVEFSYVVDELIYEEDRITRDTTIREAARMIHALLASLTD
ncbi:TetR/AcrR family transcriptional regulator [Pseudomonas sp. NCHU5208]|uniref:TetR/AcrR family transcriptional regulator n=1 Tax=unclassified Pseudomonas TaxID=196821 RepID=UPI003F99ACF8